MIIAEIILIVLRKVFLIANLVFDSTILDFGNNRHVSIVAENIFNIFRDYYNTIQDFVNNLYDIDNIINGLDICIEGINKLLLLLYDSHYINRDFYILVQDDS